MFGSGFGSSAFGQQSQPQQTGGLFGQQQPAATGFGTSAFGQTATSGFGQPATTSAFGQPAQNASPFGAGATAGTGFGAASTGFGAQQNRPFGSTTTTGGLFGASTPATSTATTGFGGFGATSTAPSAFGSTSTGTTGGGLFGQPATTSAFGASSQPAGGLFGASTQPATSAFGTTTSAFGAGTGTLTTGTSNPPFSVTSERDAGTATTNNYHSITAMPQYKNYSFEELRLQDYQQGRKTASGTATGFGAGTTTAGFGQQQPQQTSAFGQPATSAGGGLFGPTSTSGGFSPFKTGTAAFGQNAPQQTGSLFGSGTTGGFGTSQPATTGFGASTGGFGQPSTTQTGFGTSSTGAFGAAAKPGFGGFGPTATSQPASTGFGTSTTTGFGTGATGGGLFSNTSAPAFGTSQPATSAPSFGFGATSTAPASTGTTGFGGFGASNTAKPATGGFGFGSTSTASTGGFGANQQSQQKPAFSFGPQPSATSFSGLGGQQQTGSLFGNTATGTTGGGLFSSGGTQTTGFGTGTIGGFGTGGGLFGPKPAGAPPGTGLFHSQPQQGTSGFNFGGTGTAGTIGSTFPSLGGMTGFGGAQAGQQVAGPALIASVDKDPYGQNPLFQQTPGQQPQPQQPIVVVVNNTQKKSIVIPPHYKVPPRSLSSMRLRGMGPSYAQRKGVKDTADEEDSIIRPEAFIPRQSVKKLIIDKRIGENDILNAGDTFTVSGSKADGEKGRGMANRAHVTFNPQIEAQSFDVDEQNNPFVQSISANKNTFVKALAPSDSVSKTTEEEENEEDGYWMSPSLDQLRIYDSAKLTHVENFVVGRKGYGQVRFLKPVNLAGLPLTAIPGHVVTFVPRAVTVYPDHNSKPAPGNGMNVPAMISLDNCWPSDKATREPIKDVQHPRLQQHINKLKRVSETEFINYAVETGVWTFKVEHFSTYGLFMIDQVPSDEEMETETTPVPASSQLQESISNTNSLESQAEATREDIHMSEEVSPAENSKPTSLSQRNGEDEVASKPSDDIMMAHGNESDKQEVSVDDDSNASEQKPRFTEDDTGDDYYQVDAFSKRSMKYIFHSAYMEAPKSKPIDAEMRSTPEPFRGASIKRINKSKSSLYSLINQHGDILVDAGIAMGRSTRVCWGLNGQLYCAGTVGGFRRVDGDNDDYELGQLHVYDVRSYIAPEPTEKIQECQTVLEASRKHSVVSVEKDRTLSISFKPSLNFDNLSQIYDDRWQSDLWRLCSILFDPLESETLANVAGRQDELEERLRNEAVSEWLQKMVEDEVKVDTSKAEAANNGPATTFALLTGRLIADACVSAQKRGDYKLATLLAQAGGEEEMRNDIAEQIQKWSKSGADTAITHDYRKIYELLSGNVELFQEKLPLARNSSKPRTCIITENLDWKRTLGMYLWYHAFDDSLSDAIMAYDSARSCFPPSIISAPLPPHLEFTSDLSHEGPYDILYELMRFHVDKSVGLANILQTGSFTNMPLDDQLPWLLIHALRQVSPVTEDDNGKIILAQLTVQFAAELELLGMWEWAIYVLLTRDQAIKELIAKYYHADVNDEKRAFLTEQLQLPSTFFA